MRYYLIAQSLHQFVEDTNHVRLIELFVRERNGNTYTSVLADGIDSLPTADETNGGFQILERTSADFTSQVVADSSTLPRFVNHNETTSLANRVGDLADWQGIDGSKVNELDRRGWVRRAELFGKVLNQAGRRVRQELNCANFCQRERQQHVRVV